jgi:hypothetical protein
MVKPWEIDLTVYDDEVALLEGLRQKDRLACTCLLKRFAPRLYRLALQLTGDPDEAEDVLHRRRSSRPARTSPTSKGAAASAPGCIGSSSTPHWLACAASHSPRCRLRLTTWACTPHRTL